MSAERPAVVDESFRELVRDAVREVLREELAPLKHRNAGTLQGPEDGYLSVAKAARLADVAPGTIRAWIRAGRLTAQRAGRVLRVSRSELEKFMAGAPTGPSGTETVRRAAHLFGGGTRLWPSGR
jgi:excisionase family DNA binding protein